MNIRAHIKAKIRLLEADLTAQSTEFYRLSKAQNEAKIALEFTKEQITLLRTQLDALSDAS